MKNDSRNLVVTPEEPTVLKARGAGKWFADFGKAMFGTARVIINADKAGTAEICLGEKLKANGAVDRKPPGCIRCRIMEVPLRRGRHTYQVKIPPDKRNTEQPMAVLVPSKFFEVAPFRYAEVKIIGATGKLESITRLSLHAPFDEKASAFTCSDPRLTAVWDLCKHSMKATSFLGIYVDGDRERIAYEADAYINQLSHYAVDKSYKIAQRTLERFIMYPTCPTEWVLQQIPIAWADYLYTGNSRLLAKHYATLRERLLLQLARKDGLISTLTGLATPELQKKLRLPLPLRDTIDWPPASFTKGGKGELDGFEMRPINTVVNAFHYWSLDLFSQINRVLGRADDAAFCARRAKLVAGSMKRKLFDQKRGIFRDGEDTAHTALHATIFPVAFGLLPRGAEDTARRFIRRRGMACSVYGAQYLLEACYRLGMADHALALMTAEHDRGWLNMLQVGSTVTLEAWDWRYKNNLDWNHAWGAAPANIIQRFLVGVQPEKPGFETASVTPQPAGLAGFESKVPTIRGPVHVAYEKSKTRCKLAIEAPMPFLLDVSGITGRAGRKRSCRAGAHCFELAAGK